MALSAHLHSKNWESFDDGLSSRSRMLKWCCIFLNRLMTLTIDLPSELERYLLQEARSQGISLEAMTLRLLTNSIPMLDSSGSANGQELTAALPAKQQRVFGQYQGRIKMSEDFDEPLPDSFWLGE